MDARLTLVETWDEVLALVDWLGTYRGRWLGVDTETEGLSWWRHGVRTVQVGGRDAGWVLELARWRGVVEHVLATWPGEYVLHNAKFDQLMLAHAGVHLDRARVHDSMLAVRALEPHLRSALKVAAERHVDPRAGAGQEELSSAMGARTGWDWATVPIDLPAYWRYAALDPVLTVRLMEVVEPRLTPEARRGYELDLGVSQVLMDMERRGMRIDRAYCEERVRTLGAYAGEVRDAARARFGVDVGRDARLVEYLLAEGAPLVTYTEKGNVQLDNAVLEGLDHPVAAWVLAYRRAAKRVSTYYLPWTEHADGDDLLHAWFSVVGATTGRMSSERPNLQNVPRSREVRNGLVPAAEGDVLVLADYDQIELRVLAALADEPAMLRAIREGVDLHTNTARLVYGTDAPTREQRRVAKTANFAQVYGAGTAKFAATAAIGVDEATAFREAYAAEFPLVGDFQRRLSAQRDADGLYREVTPSGRLQVATEGYKLVNYVVQGTAADVFKRKLIELDAAGLGAHLRVPIHDEVAFSVPRADAADLAAELPSVMEDRDSFQVPLTVGVDVVERWGDKYEAGS